MTPPAIGRPEEEAVPVTEAPLVEVSMGIVTTARTSKATTAMANPLCGMERKLKRFFQKDGFSAASSRRILALRRTSICLEAASSMFFLGKARSRRRIVSLRPSNSSSWVEAVEVIFPSMTWSANSAS